MFLLPFTWVDKPLQSFRAAFVWVSAKSVIEGGGGKETHSLLPNVKNCPSGRPMGGVIKTLLGLECQGGALIIAERIFMLCKN